jgi:hypothetical protein
MKIFAPLLVALLLMCSESKTRTEDLPLNVAPEHTFDKFKGLFDKQWTIIPSVYLKKYFGLDSAKVGDTLFKSFLLRNYRGSYTGVVVQKECTGDVPCEVQSLYLFNEEGRLTDKMKVASTFASPGLSRTVRHKLLGDSVQLTLFEVQRFASENDETLEIITSDKEQLYALDGNSGKLKLIKSVDHQLDLARNYALTFNPADDENPLHDVPYRVITAFRGMRVGNPDMCEKYLTLIFIKIYKAHLQCCDEALELRNYPGSTQSIERMKDPLMYEFNLITNLVSSDAQLDFIPSSLGYNWANDKRALRNDPEIEAEMLLVRQELDRIEKSKRQKKK